jgi:hypothetical protein
MPLILLAVAVFILFLLLKIYVLDNLLRKRLIDFLKEMEDPRRDIFIQIYYDYEDLFKYASGSSHNHQFWKGGYIDHITEILRANYAYYKALMKIRAPGFSRDSATIALFLHDIEKPFRYAPKDNVHYQYWHDKFAEIGDWEEIKWLVIDELMEKYNFSLTNDEINALKYTHGEGDDYRKDMCVSTPLAAHVHHCDNTSARVWPNDGKGLG